MMRAVASIGLGGLLLAGWLTVPCNATATQAATPADTNAVPTPPAVESTLQPDAKRLFALGMIETGNNDHDVGGAGEISRYQIQPAVWKCYSKSDDYTDPEVSLQVARQHWIYLATYFKEKTGREPDDFDMYVLWNTRFGYYAKNGFSQKEISPVIRDRAGRFVNLVNRKT